MSEDFTSSVFVLLTAVSRCTTQALCSGTADEERTTIGYGANAQPVTITRGAGDNSVSATTGLGYDWRGNLTSVDGPLAGAADTTRLRYDEDRARVGVIAMLGSNGGSHVAERTSYRADGRVASVAIGTVTDQSDAAWAAFAVSRSIDTAYDGYNRVATVALTGGGATYALTQYGYDALGRATCVATRLNPTAYGALPVSACTSGTAGSFGPDRIARTGYDQLGRVWKTETAVGTADESVDAQYAFTANGQVESVLDAEGNRTGYAYDGHDRLSRTYFPVPAKGSGVANGADYQELGYDAAGNVASVRGRDGRVLGYAHDALGQVTVKTVPDGSGLPGWATRDVHYGYDLTGRLRSANYDYATGEGVSATYDALGRKTGEIVNLDGLAKTLTFASDAAGNRMRMSWADGRYVNYRRSASGAFLYTDDDNLPFYLTATDALGRTAAIHRWRTGVGWSLSTGYGYDAIGRIGGLSHDLPAGAGATTAFAYNPAGQIASATCDNDAYAWPGHVNVDRPYASNGLNQVTSAGSATFGYDANGNLTSDGTGGFTYDAENRLIAAANGAELRYDPLGRLANVAKAGAVTRFLYDGEALVAEYDAAGNMLRRYIHGEGADQPLVWFEGAQLTSPRYLYADERGSVVAVADAGGNAIARNSYDDYGIPRNSTNPDLAPYGRFGYTGQVWLPVLGLWYYKARMYSPTLGRFLQTDPIGYADGLNWYAYVANDPVNKVDPSGLRCRDAYFDETAGIYHGCDDSIPLPARSGANYFGLSIFGSGSMYGSLSGLSVGGGSQAKPRVGRNASQPNPEQKPRSCANVIYQLADLADKGGGYLQYGALAVAGMGKGEALPAVGRPLIAGGLQAYARVGVVRTVTVAVKAGIQTLFGGAPDIGPLLIEGIQKLAGLDQAGEAITGTISEFTVGRFQSKDRCE